MNTFKKSIIALVTLTALTSVSVTTANANHWKKPFIGGLGVGVGFGIVNAILQPKSQTVYVQQQPTCTVQYQTVYGPYGPYQQKVTYCQ